MKITAKEKHNRYSILFILCSLVVFVAASFFAMVDMSHFSTMFAGASTQLSWSNWFGNLWWLLRSYPLAWLSWLAAFVAVAMGRIRLGGLLHALFLLCYHIRIKTVIFTIQNIGEAAGGPNWMPLESIIGTLFAALLYLVCAVVVCICVCKRKKAKALHHTALVLMILQIIYSFFFGNWVVALAIAILYQMAVGMLQVGCAGEAPKAQNKGDMVTLVGSVHINRYELRGSSITYDIVDPQDSEHTSLRVLDCGYAE